MHGAGHIDTQASSTLPVFVHTYHPLVAGRIDVSAPLGDGATGWEPGSLLPRRGASGRGTSSRYQHRWQPSRFCSPVTGVASRFGPRTGDLDELMAVRSRRWSAAYAALTPLGVSAREDRSLFPDCTKDEPGDILARLVLFLIHVNGPIDVAAARPPGGYLPAAEPPLYPIRESL